MVIDVLFGNQCHVESGCFSSQEFTRCVIHNQFEQMNAVIIRVIVGNGFQGRNAVVIRVIVGNGFQGRNLVIICLVFTVGCFSVPIQDRLDASWLAKVFLSKIYFIVVSTFVVLFILCFSVICVISNTVIFCV